jgi:hypothetical protein
MAIFNSYVKLPEGNVLDYSGWSMIIDHGSIDGDGW